jgi:hypothetical protein
MTKKNRRQFIKGLTFSYLSLVVSPYIIGLDSRIFASTTDSSNKDIHTSSEAIGSADLGPLNGPNKNGVMLPDGLEARIIAHAGNITPFLSGPFRGPRSAEPIASELL